MLLIDDRQAEPVEDDAVLDHRVGADEMSISPLTSRSSRAVRSRFLVLPVSSSTVGRSLAEALVEPCPGSRATDRPGSRSAP